MKPTFICLHCNQEFNRNPSHSRKASIIVIPENVKMHECAFGKEINELPAKRIARSARSGKRTGLENNPGHQYIKDYRARNPDYVNRNRELQRIRDTKYRHTCRIDYIKNLVKSNTFRSYRD
jgi:hypothetical protein